MLLLFKISIVLEVSRIYSRGDRTHPPICIIEKSSDKSRLQNLMIVQPHFAQLIDLSLIYISRISGDKPRIFAESVIYARKLILTGAIIAGKLIYQRRILPQSS